MAVLDGISISHFWKNIGSIEDVPKGRSLQSGSPIIWGFFFLFFFYRGEKTADKLHPPFQKPLDTISIPHAYQ